MKRINSIDPVSSTTATQPLLNTPRNTIGGPRGNDLSEDVGGKVRRNALLPTLVMLCGARNGVHYQCKDARTQHHENHTDRAVDILRSPPNKEQRRHEARMPHRPGQRRHGHAADTHSRRWQARVPPLGRA